MLKFAKLFDIAKYAKVCESVQTFRTKHSSIGKGNTRTEIKLYLPEPEPSRQISSYLLRLYRQISWYLQNARLPIIGQLIQVD